MPTVESSTTLITVPAASREFQPFGADGFTFADLIDVINPLQHLPIVSTLYRRVTGDVLEPGPRVLGGTLFGGPLGAAAAVVNAIVEAESGKDVGEHVAAALLGSPDNPIFVADAESFHVPEGDPADNVAELHTGLAPLPVESRDLDELPAAPPWTPAVAALGATAAEVPAVAATPTGATAAAGGWFTETMLSALRKYEESLAAGRAGPATVQRTI